MRIPPVLFGVSLAANLGLAFVWFYHPKYSPETGPAAVLQPVGRAASPVEAAAAQASADALSPEMAKAIPDLFQQLIDGDLGAEVSRLRASGIPEETVNLIAQVVILQKYKKAFEESGADGMLQMWGSNYALTDAQRERQKKMQETLRKLSDETREAGVDSNWFTSFGDKVPGISADKAKQIARIEQDRQDLRSQVHTEASGMMLERDNERLKYIEEEFKKDLAALLSPEELDAWKAHSSDTARNLRMQLAYMSPTEDEFKKILKLQETFDEAWPTGYGVKTDWQKRSEAEREMKKQIVDLLGPERAADYEKATDQEFGTLSKLEYRLQLPKGSAEKVYGLHQETEKAAQKIRSDKSLGDEDRKESLKVLAEQVKSELTGVLGEEGFKAYKAQHSHWIDNLAR